MKRSFVLGLDGLPFSLLQSWFDAGKLPRFAGFAKKYNIKQMNSVYPTVSSVAWTTYATGVNPAEHGIFGFIDRNPNPFEIFIPTASDRKAPTIWQKLSDQEKKVVIINVPLTYPPEPVNGILISGFLCTDINKVSYPESISEKLQTMGYVIDVDAWLARENKQEFMDKIHEAMEKRFQVTFDLMENNEWDFFQLHIMETDRLFHFFWYDLEKQGEFYPQVESFFEKMDNYIGELIERLAPNDSLMILSDHGFCGIKTEVQDISALDGFTESVNTVETALAMAHDRWLHEFDLIVVDDISPHLERGDINTAQVLALLDNRPPDTSIILTGASSPELLIRKADLVTEFRQLK